MEITPLTRWLALGGLVFIIAVFAAAETSLFALSPLERLRLREKHPRRGSLVESLVNRPRRLLITVLMGVDLMNALASVIATSLALTLWGPHGKWLALIVISPSILFLGELIPRSLALAYPTRLARWVAPVIKPAIFLLTPFRVVLLQISHGILATLGFRPELSVPSLHQEDFVRLVEESHQGGMIAGMEKEFIHNLLALGELRVGQIMVPRPDIFSLSTDLPPQELIQAIKLSRHSRIPIYQDNPDNVLGILHAKDLLKLCSGETCDPGFIRNLLRPPHYVPENKKAFDLLTELLAQHLRLALVVDEYGWLAGLVTVEDLLEELCGEIPQEFQVEEKALEETAPGRWRVKATLSLAEFNEALGLEWPTEEFDSIGGLVLNLFGTLPREGHQVSYDGFTFRVVRMKGARILDLEVTRQSS